MSPEQAIFSAAAILVLGGGVSALVADRRRAVGWVAVFFVAISSALVFPAALQILLSGQPIETAPLLVMPLLNAQLIFRLDSLSALFLLIVSVISLLTTLYSIGYMARYEKEHLARYYPPLLLFFASILGVVCAADWFFFIIFWEIMSVCSYTLVVFEQGNTVSLRAGFKYILITHAATAGMFVAAILLWHFGNTHSFTFADSKQTLTLLAGTRPLLVHILLGLWLIGFGTKAGMLPFGDWLPGAYEAAPGVATAAFAGTMTNLGVYGLVRVFCWMLPASDYSQIWGIVIAVFGAGSIFVGTLAALGEKVAHDDCKRFLALNAIGQMGYILLGLGMALYFLPVHPSVALLALLAAVFHMLNGVCYKPLLFFSAGSIRLRTGTHNLNLISGLGAVMPLTAVTATIASLSIAGIPPFNGFVSKWMLYAVSILAPQPVPVFVVLGVMAMFVALVSLAVFLKFIGAAFLGPLAVPEGNSLQSGEVPATMQIPQLILAGLCLLFGLVPLLPLSVVHRAVTAALPPGQWPGFDAVVGSAPGGLSLMLDNQAAAVWFPPVALVILLVCMGLGWWLLRSGGAARRKVAEWHCGTMVTNEMARYQARSFYGPFKGAFARLYPTFGAPKAGYPESLARAFDLDKWLYGPLVEAGRRLSERIRQTHGGIPQMYLVWQVAGAALVVAALFWILR